MKRKLCLLTAIVSCLYAIKLVALPAPVTVSDCNKDLQIVLKNEEAFIHRALTSGQCWYLKYDMITEAKHPYGGEFQTVHDRGEIMATSLVRYTRSGSTEVIMDSADVFTIDRSKKKLMRTPTVKGVFRSEYNSFLSLVRDSLMKEYKVVACERAIIKGAGQRKYVLHAKDTVRAPYRTMTIYAEEKTQMLTQMNMVYNPTMFKNIKQSTLVVEERSARAPLQGWSDIRGLYLLLPAG